MLFCDDTKIRRYAVHEAGHAVFMWRGGATLYGERFDDRLAPFDEILVNRYDCSVEGGLPPLLLEDGQTLVASGAVVNINNRRRLSVPGVRRQVGLSRAAHRAEIAEAKLHAQAWMIDYLAGPVVESHFRAVWEGYEQFFDWWRALEDEEDELTGGNGDVTKAFAIAEQELCRGRQKVAACMNDAVRYIEAKLDGDMRYLRAIEALADALGKKFRLDHEEAVAVMRAAWGAE